MKELKKICDALNIEMREPSKTFLKSDGWLSLKHAKDLTDDQILNVAKNIEINVMDEIEELSNESVENLHFAMVILEVEITKRNLWSKQTNLEKLTEAYNNLK